MLKQKLRMKAEKNGREYNVQIENIEEVII